MSKEVREIQAVGQQSVVATPSKTAGEVSASASAYPQPNPEQNSDAVKVEIAASQVTVEAEEKRLQDQAEARKTEFEKIAQENFSQRQVVFIGAENGNDIRFQVVDKESGEVVVSYPPNVAAKKMESAGNPATTGEIINKEV